MTKPGIILLATCLLALLSGSLGQANGNWSNCGPALNRAIDFVDFFLFSYPITVHDVAHMRFTIQSNVPFDDLTLAYQVSYQGEVVAQVSGLDMCNVTGINCPFSATPAEGLTLWFDFPVPRIPRGEYEFTFEIYENSGTTSAGCLNFYAEVVDPPSASSCFFTSTYQAVIEGKAYYEKSIGLEREEGDLIQVGPIGDLPQHDTVTFDFGNFLSFQGSEDFFYAWMSLAGEIATKNYFWGLNGSLTTKRVDADGGQWHEYTGEFHVGYDDGQVSFGREDPSTALVLGNFTIDWYFNSTSELVQLNGSLSSTVSQQPQGWPWPTTFGRLNLQKITTSAEGIFTVEGTRTYCLCGQAQCAALLNTASNIVQPDSPLVNHWQAGLIAAAAILAAALLAALLIFLLVRRRQKYHQEDGVFDITRKPEYGTVLVVDDIVQETRRRESEDELLGRVGINGDDTASYTSYTRTLSRTDSYSDRSGRSRTPSRSRNGTHSDSYTCSYSETEDRTGTQSYSETEDRSRSRSRSRSRDRSYTGTGTGTHSYDESDRTGTQSYTESAYSRTGSPSRSPSRSRSSSPDRSITQTDDAPSRYGTASSIPPTSDFSRTASSASLTNTHTVTDTRERTPVASGSVTPASLSRSESFTGTHTGTNSRSVTRTEDDDYSQSESESYTDSQSHTRSGTGSRSMSRTSSYTSSAASSLRSSRSASPERR